MRAWTFRTRGLPTSVLKLDPNFPIPPMPTGSNLRIKVSHASLTPGMANGMSIIPAIPFLSRPYIPELDFSGTIEVAGASAPTTLQPGVRVFGSLAVLDFVLFGKGTLTEYVVAPAHMVTPLPDTAGFDMAEAAALNGNGQTAVQMVRNARIRKGSRVFVNGGSGGIGTLVVQIAKAEGAYIVATGSGEKAAPVKQLGADEV
jgi:NADPH:quinone reductase-like Zn-dependent oxidoreductase